MKRLFKHLFFPLAIICISIVLLFINLRTEMTLTYFPLTDNVRFISAVTELNVDEAKRTATWKIYSETDQRTYLRQDVSLLFANGRLIGVQNKWQQHERALFQEQQFSTAKTNTFYQALSYHHAEIHENEQLITSTHRLSNAEKMIFYPTNISEQNKAKIEQNLRANINDTLAKHWRTLMKEHQVNPLQYILFPLTEIEQLRKYSLETMSADQVEQMIGQLWEGLYKNYLIPALSEKAQGYMPVILIAKDRSHLLVLYELNDKSEKLVQMLH